MGPLAKMVGFKLELIVTLTETVLEHPDDGFVAVMVMIPFPEAPHFTDKDPVFCPVNIVPLLTAHKRVLPGLEVE